MRLFACAAAVSAAAVMVLGGATASAEGTSTLGTSTLSFQAEQGAHPVSGRLGEWDNADIREYDDVVKVDAETDQGWDWIHLELGAGNGARLAPGTYTDVRNRLYHPEGPNIMLVSNGLGCGDDYATFTIERIERAEGRLTALDATVEHRCGDPAGPAFRARVHYAG